MLTLNLITPQIAGTWTFCKHAKLGVVQRYDNDVCVLCYNTKRRRRRAENPEPARAQNRNWRNANIATVRAYDRKRYAESPDRRRAGRAAVHKYLGIVWAPGQTKDTLWAEQDGLCANKACQQPFCDLPPRQVHVDHDHSITDGSPNVRGLLCQRCNLMAGHVQDNAQILMGLASYLGRAS